MTQEEFVQFAEAQRFTAEDCPILLGGGRGWWPFPCIDTNRGRLGRLNRNRDREMVKRGKMSPDRRPVTIRPIQNGQYYVAVPRESSYRSSRAEQLGGR